MQDGDRFERHRNFVNFKAFYSVFVVITKSPLPLEDLYCALFPSIGCTHLGDCSNFSKVTFRLYSRLDLQFLLHYTLFFCCDCQRQRCQWFVALQPVNKTRNLPFRNTKKVPLNTNTQ